MRFPKAVVFANGLLPTILLLLDWRAGRLGANPVEFVTRATGVLTLVFLTLTLCVRPLSRRWPWLMKERRALGLFAFFYGVLHLFTYVVFDRGGQLGGVPGDIYARPFIALGMLSFFLMVPLALTSTDRMIRRLGTRWRQLHRLTYLAAIGGVAHFWLIVKSDLTYPLAFAFSVGLLLAYRLRR